MYYLFDYKHSTISKTIPKFGSVTNITPNVLAFSRSESEPVQKITWRFGIE